MNIKFYYHRAIILYHHFYLFIDVEQSSYPVLEVHIPDDKLYSIYLDTFPDTKRKLKIGGLNLNLMFVFQSHIQIPLLTAFEYHQLILNHPELDLGAIQSYPRKKIADCLGFDQLVFNPAN